MSQECGALLSKYRNIAGFTQEKAADLLEVSVRTLAAWEWGETTPPQTRVVAMVDIYGAPTLAIEYLRSTSVIAYEILPPVRELPLPQAVCQLLSAIRTLEKIHAGDQLLEIAADGRVDELERPAFDRLLEDLEPIMAAVLALKYAREGEQ